VLAVIHYYLLVKLDITWPVIYGTILAVSLAWRINEARSKALKKAKKAASIGRLQQQAR
jgi:DMSO/TMAO reductase YedYZ heme-binding membrane subunit